ncbi:hypothetical protein [Spiroplasma endosymbiont of Nebria brevicollis]|uniref:hypothetical protein n=1 Tax=Spiroplasma endosymbiont of Nebria brevicollis TaxID=3066284 RepID=UPI00313F3B3C
MISTKTIIEEEIQSDTKEVSFKFIKHDENWHNGKTYKFDNKSDERYSQFKTVINEENQDYFIYDEIIRRKEKPVLFLRLFDIKSDEYLELITYLEKNKVVQQIRHLSYEQFFNEIENDEDPIKSDESKNTTIIKTSFLDFIENVNQEKNDCFIKQVTKPFWKRVPWKIVGLAVFLGAWCAIPVIGNLVIAPLLVGVVSASILTWLPFVTAGLITGCVVSGYNKYKSRFKKWLFPNWKSKNEINLENKLQEQKLILEKEHQKELFLSLTQEGKQERILNSFHQLWERNKNKTFVSLQSELNEKFSKNKKELNQQNLENFCKRKNELQAKAEVERANLSTKQNVIIKDSLGMIDFVVSKINKENQKPQPDEHGLRIYEKEVTNFSEKIEEILNKNKKSDNIEEEDVKEKSPIRKMRQISL